MRRMSIFAEHTLLLHLGDGGMGTVWLARDPAGGRVALKTLKAEPAKDPRVRQMFAKEMRIAAAIRHANVATVVASGADAGVPYLVMEWIDGLSVRALGRSAARRGGVPLGVALRIVHDACAGLHAAHELCDARGGRQGHRLRRREGA